MIGREAPHRLSLNFGIECLGSGVLEYGIGTLEPERNRVTVTAHWHAPGVWRLACRYALVPAHLFLCKPFRPVMTQRALAPDDSRRNNS